MHSHDCQFGLSDVLWSVCPPVFLLVLGAMTLHVAAGIGLLPAPRPTLDMDRTILFHQAHASQSRHSADLVLLGDSSCLMDVSARQLGRELGRETLNLGTFSYLDLAAHGWLLQQFNAANPGRLRTVLLLMHPEALRRQEASSYHIGLLRSFLGAPDLELPGEGNPRLLDRVLGLELVRSRGLGRLLPWPLPKEHGAFYGFTDDLARYLDSHQGSAVDPNRFDPQSVRGSAEYRLARKWEAASRGFRAVLPKSVRLIVGITPAPASFVLPEHAVTCRRMLSEWGGWLEADAVLLNMPFVLPDDLFASVTHLNAAGAERFTELLAEQLNHP